MGPVHGKGSVMTKFSIFSTIILSFSFLSDVVETKKEKKRPENGWSQTRHFLSHYPDVWMCADQMFSAVSLSTARRRRRQSGDNDPPHGGRLRAADQHEVQEEEEKQKCR